MIGLSVLTIIETVIVVALGGMVAAVLARLRRGQIRVYRCAACGRPTSRGYPRCRHCDHEQPDAV